MELFACLLLAGLLIGFGMMMLILSDFDNVNVKEISIGALLIILASALLLVGGINKGSGRIKNAENKLSLGETYECIAGPTKNDEGHYAIVKTGDNKIFGLEFKKMPPQKGVVSKTESEIVFLPTAEQSENKGVIIPNPLAKTPAETPTKQ